MNCGVGIEFFLSNTYFLMLRLSIGFQLNVILGLKENLLVGGNMQLVVFCFIPNLLVEA